MKLLDVDKTASEQTFRVDLDGFETEIRIYWSEIPAHMTTLLNSDGQLFMDVKNTLFDIKAIALTTGNELMLPYAFNEFGGFVVIADDNPTIDGKIEWSLNYVPINELSEIRKLYGSII